MNELQMQNWYNPFRPQNLAAAQLKITRAACRLADISLVSWDRRATARRPGKACLEERNHLFGERAAGDVTASPQGIFSSFL